MSKMRYRLLLGFLILMASVSCWSEIRKNDNIVSANLNDVTLDLKLTKSSSQVTDGNYIYKVAVDNLELKWTETAIDGSHFYRLYNCVPIGTYIEDGTKEGYVATQTSEGCAAEEQIWTLRMAQPSGDLQLWCNNEKVIQVNISSCTSFEGSAAKSSAIDLSSVEGSYKSGWYKL